MNREELLDLKARLKTQRASLPANRLPTPAPEPPVVAEDTLPLLDRDSSGKVLSGELVLGGAEGETLALPTESGELLPADTAEKEALTEKAPLAQESPVDASANEIVLIDIKFQIEKD